MHNNDFLHYHELRSNRLVFVPLLGIACLLFPKIAWAISEGRPCTPKPAGLEIRYGELVACQLDTAGGVDVYRFTGSVGEVVSISGVADNGSSVVCVNLVGPGDTPIVSTCTFRRVRIDRELTASGTYALHISSTQSVRLAYTLSLVRIVPLASTSSPLAFGQDRDGEINPFGDVDVYYFAAREGDALTLNLTALSGVPSIRVFDPRGTMLRELLLGFTFQASVTGIYTILVDPDGVASYRIKAQCTGSCSARRDIVIGTGAGGDGWIQIRGDASTGYAHKQWFQIPWPAYNATNGETRPVTGDLDGDGKKEIVVGLGSGGEGWIAILSADALTGEYSLRTWLQVPWSDYNSSNGETLATIGDLDGDGKYEIAIGLGEGGGGWVQIRDDHDTGYAHKEWIQLAWAAYNSTNGSTRPTVGGSVP